jgi:hypothetical protein
LTLARSGLRLNAPDHQKNTADLRQQRQPQQCEVVTRGLHEATGDPCNDSDGRDGLRMAVCSTARMATSTA